MRHSPRHTPREPDGNPWPALWALVIGFFMILVDSTIVSIATPALIASFDVGITPVLWVTSAYLLAYAVPLLVTGRLGDRFGPKAIYQAGLVVFTLASLWCGLTGEFNLHIGWLIAARAVQGLGASLMTPQTMTVITRTFPADRRGSAMALWGATAGVATLVGPILGGVLLDTLGWEWIFWVNVPVGVVALVMAARLVPRLETHAHRIDGLGVALSAVGLFVLVFGIQEGDNYAWGHIWGPLSVPLLIGLGVVLLALFVWWQARMRGEPLVPLQLFADRNFSMSNIAIATMGFTITAMIFPFMIYAQVVRGASPTQAALLLAPQAVMSIVLAPAAGRLTDRVHPRWLAGSGTLLLGITLFALTLAMTPDSPIWHILVIAVFMGLANSLIWGPLSASATRNLPMHLAGAGSGVYNTTRQMGAVLGSAGIAVLMQARLVALLGEGSGPLAGGMAAGGQLPVPLREPVAQAMAQSVLLPAAVILLGAVAALFLEQAKHLRRGSARDAGGASRVSDRNRSEPDATQLQVGQR